MSNIRPIGDPAVATAMLATMQSLSVLRSVPKGITEPHWRILQCIAQAGPFTPSKLELRMASGLGPRALEENLRSLRWKGLIAMGSLVLSPSAEAMFVPSSPTVIGVNEGNAPNIEPLDPADVPACMRPDCTPPERPVEEVRNALLTRKSEKSCDADGPVDDPRHSGGRSGRTSAKDFAARRVHRAATAIRPDRSARPTASAVAEEVAAPLPQISAPPATPPKFTNWIEQRAARIANAIAFLGSLGIPVVVTDRHAEIRTYFVSANRRSLFAEEVIELAIEKGWAE